MGLKEQIISIIFSFSFGIILSILYNLNYYLLFNKNRIFKIIFNFIFVFDLVLIYFLIIKMINNAICLLF